MNVCRFGYKRSDGKCALNGKKCRTTCGSNVDVDVKPKTVKDVLLKRWAQDTEDMQCAFVHKDMSGGYWYMTKNKYGMFCWMWTLDHSDAMRKQAEFLNSAAEGANK